MLFFIKVLEKEAREQVSKLDGIRNGNIINKKRKRNDNVIDNELELKIPSFYYSFQP